MKNSKTDANIEFLFKGIITLDNVDDCRNFFEDLCTVTELASITQRLKVAKMLTENCVYTDIAAKTGASTATISRVNRTMSDGTKTVLERLGKIKNV